MIRQISDTALLCAAYRAEEGRRRHALIRDPFAGRLAGARGARLAARLPLREQRGRSSAVRTLLIDQLLMRQVRQGADLVINLGAGLDTRPYRMDLPGSLPWVEVDLPNLIARKERRLAGVAPACRLWRVGLDLADRGARQRLIGRLGRRSENALVVSEGLLIYLTRAQAGMLARDLATAGFTRWVLDLVSPAALRLQRQGIGPALCRAGAQLRFAPCEGPAFFRRHGWEVIAKRSLLGAAAQLVRLPQSAAASAVESGLDGWVCLLRRAG